MTMIKPLRGLKYSRDAGPLVELIAPPYDVIDAAHEKELRKRSPHNVVRLILPEEKPGDGKDVNRYVRARQTLEDWLAREVLVKDEKPAVYRYLMNFDMKTPSGIANRTRAGFVCLMKLHPYEDREVRPHERTMAGPKQDRFELMRHTRAHLSQVFMLYPDNGGAVDGALGDEPPAGAKSFGCEDDQGVTHTVWPVTDEAAIEAVTEHLEKTPLYIADGHHRYETALAFHRHVRERQPLFEDGADHVLAYFTPAEAEGLAIFPYHRLVRNLPKRRLSGLVKKLSEYFQVEKSLVSPLDPGARRREFVAGLVERGKSAASFAMVDGHNGKAFYLTMRPDADLFRSCVSEVEMVLCGMDVVILEDLVLMGILGMNKKDLLGGKHLSYETDFDRVLDTAAKPPNQLAFLMNPTPVRDVIKIADLNGIMPEKSTYFFPKPATGLVMNLMD